jgi:hypothetical protein
MILLLHRRRTMRPKKPETARPGDLFRARLDQIINLKHELAQLAGHVDWDFIEPVIGHLKAEGHLGRCYLKGRAGGAANAILSAVGHNFRRVLAWLRALLLQILVAILRLLISRSALDPAS